MWGIVVFLLIVQRTFTLPELVSKDNIRNPRQLNFDNCCLCSLEGEESDQSTPNARTVTSNNNCPCNLIADSQGESSIFKPALRAVETFTRPVAKRGEPKPLLQPEVVLASSVLETLHEATNQEYQEALARDAARSKAADSDTPGSETKNIVNIILTPKSSYDKDLIPEESHLKETRCIHSHLGRTNSLQPLKFRSPLHLVQEVLKSPKLTNNHFVQKRVFDMDGSTSNVKESILSPLKTNVLDDIKTKSNLLKLRLFPNALNVLKNNPINNNYRNVNQGTENSNHMCIDENYFIQEPNYKLTSTSNSLQNPAHHNILTKMPPDTQSEHENDDFISSPSNPTKNILKYTLRDRSQLRNIKIKPSLDSNEQSNSQFLDEVNVLRTKYVQESENMKMEQDDSLISRPEPINILDEDNFVKKSDHGTNTGQGNILGSLKNIDVSPSASEIDEIINLENDTESKATLNGDQQINVVRNPDLHINNMNSYLPNIQYGINENISLNLHEIKTGPPEEEQTNVEYENIPRKEIDIIKLDDLNDLRPGETLNTQHLNFGLSHISECTNSSDYDKSTRSSNINDQKVQLENQNTVSSFSTGENVLELDRSNGQKSDILPNIRADILRTIENFKEANERIQEKLRSNVQDALQSVSLGSISNIQSNQSYVPLSPTSIIERKTNEIINDTNISTQDLQKMSDLLLDISNMKNKKNTSLPITEEEIFKESENNQISYKNDPNETLELKNSENTFVKSDINSEVEPVDSISKDDDKMDKNVCDGNLNNKSTTSSELNTEEKEMTAQASDAIFNRTPQLRLNSDGIFQPKIDAYNNHISNIKHFFENVRSSVTDIFQNEKKGFGSGLNKADDESNAEHSTCLNAEENHSEHHVSNDDTKHYDLSDKVIRDDTFKNTPDFLRSYKARVATPQSLDINPLYPIYPSSNKEADILSSASQKSSIKSLKIPVDVPNYYDLKSLVKKNNENKLLPKLSLQKNKAFPDILPLKASSLSEDLRFRAENSLKNIQEYLELTFNDPHKVKEKKILGEPFINRDSIFKYILKPFENEDITNLSSLDQTTPLKGSQLFTPNRKNGIPNRSELNRNISKKGTKTFKNADNNDNSKLLRPAAVKRISLVNNERNTAPMSENLKLLSITPGDTTDFSLTNRHKTGGLNIKQKIGTLSNQKNSEPKHLRIFTQTPSLRNNFKLKPLKESKVTISFTTTSIRPDILEARLKPTFGVDPQKSKSAATSERLSKLSKKILDKRPTFESKLKSSEPRTLASENLLTKVVFTDKNVDQPIHTESVASDGELETVHHLNQDKLRYIDNPNTRFSSRNNKISKDSLLNLSAKNDDNYTTQLGSNNIIIPDPPLTLEEPLKEKVSYKCKMVCIKDILDATEKNE